jgi:hypothetical protein
MKNLGQGFVTYTFGQEPPVVNFSGILLNTAIEQWSELFMALYHYFLRAPKLAELSTLHDIEYSIVIEYQRKVMEGSMINLTKNTNAANEQGVSFSFQLLLKKMYFKWEPPRTFKVNFPASTIEDPRFAAASDQTDRNAGGSPVAQYDVQKALESANTIRNNLLTNVGGTVA